MFLRGRPQAETLKSRYRHHSSRLEIQHGWGHEAFVNRQRAGTAALYGCTISRFSRNSPCHVWYQTWPLRSFTLSIPI